MEKFENQLLESYESTLSKEGKEIRKEVDSMFCENNELLVEKANAYCLFFISHPKRVDFDPKLVDRCKKYLNDMDSYSRIKRTLEDIESHRISTHSRNIFAAGNLDLKTSS